MHCNYIPWDINVTSISPEEKQSHDAHSMFLLFKAKVLNAVNKIRESKKRPDNDSILDYIIKTGIKCRQTSYN